MRGVSRRAGVVPFAMRPAARARIRFDAFGDRRRTAEGGPELAGRIVFLRARVRHRIFGGVYRTGSFGERGGIVPRAKPEFAGADRGRCRILIHAIELDGRQVEPGHLRTKTPLYGGDQTIFLNFFAITRIPVIQSHD